jgi:hypothetical protein
MSSQSWVVTADSKERQSRWRPITILAVWVTCRRDVFSNLYFCHAVWLLGSFLLPLQTITPFCDPLALDSKYFGNFVLATHNKTSLYNLTTDVFLDLQYNFTDIFSLLVPSIAQTVTSITYLFAKTPIWILPILLRTTECSFCKFFRMDLPDTSYWLDRIVILR